VQLGFALSAHGLFSPSFNAIVVMGVEPHERSKILAVFTVAFCVGFSGTSLVGPLADAAGYPAVFWVVGAVTAAGVLVAGAVECAR
jgi:MFS family permease